MNGHLHALTALTLTIIKPPLLWNGFRGVGFECVEFTEMMQDVVKCGHYLFVFCDGCEMRA